MVKLTIELITKSHFSNQKKKIEENFNQYLNRITHFYLQDKYIDEIVSFLIYLFELVFDKYFF